MANQLDPNKRRVTYAEWIEVFDEIEKIAKDEGKSPTEVIRETVLKRANNYRKRTGRKPLPFDPSAHQHQGQG